MSNVPKAVIGLMCLFVLQACDMFDIHPYDGDINGAKQINNRNISRIERQSAKKDTIRYAFISDSQRWHDELEDFVKSTNKRNDLDFVIHGGDLTDFGITKEFIWQRDILEKLKIPYVALIGNHDGLGNGEEIFSNVFGALNFSFIAGKTKFICLNTNALEANYSVPIPDFAFLRDEETKRVGEYDKTVVVMHAKPTSEQFNNNVKDVFHYSITRFPNLLYANHGHDHRYEVLDLFDDGIRYYGTPNIGKRQFLIFTITPNSYTHELVSF